MRQPKTNLYAAGATTTRTWLLLALFLAPVALFSNNIAISGIRLLSHQPGASARVSFDLRWDNSWRASDAPGNFDAAWVFIKFRAPGGPWQHAWLGEEGHLSGSGTPATIELGLQDMRQPFDPASNPGIGAMIYRSASGSGTFNTVGTALVWNHGAQGISSLEHIDVQVFAIEMVMVPGGAFWVGDGSSAGTLQQAGAGLPLQVSASGSVINSADGILDDTQLRGSGIWISGVAGISRSTSAAVDLNPDFPTGFGGFYTMKYEITQGQYRDFLNTLTREQQQARTASDISGTSITNRYLMTNSASSMHRNGLRCAPTLPATGPIAVFCDLNGNGTGNEADDGEWMACNFLSWADGAAFADWAGLRPLTELEYEKACRGSEAPLAGAFAWGSTDLANTAYSVSAHRSSSESIATNFNASSGNASYQLTGGALNGPLRVGVFAANASNAGRISSGAGYYGAMELSGNLCEVVVSLGNPSGRTFVGKAGDGELGPTGDADSAGWPGPDGTGTMARGGAWNTSATALRVSDRSGSAADPSTRQNNLGFRGGRGLPSDTLSPSSIAVLDCPGATTSAPILINQPANGIILSVPYAGGNGGSFPGSTIASSGVTGITALLEPGNLSAGSGALTLTLTGTPSSRGQSLFALDIAGQACTVSLDVAQRCQANISANTPRTFMCYNLGAANTDADPLVPSWEINGGYWQWGRANQAAAGPAGPGASGTNAGAVPGWNNAPAPTGAWTDQAKGPEDPCPDGFRIPSAAEWNGVLAHNTLSNRGTWTSSATNYSAGKMIGDALFLPATGQRSYNTGALGFRGRLGYYWSSTPFGTVSAWGLAVFNTGANTKNEYGRTIGHSIRCIAE